MGRRARCSKAMGDASIIAALREQFRIVQISIQRTHVHMRVEATTRWRSREVQGFTVSALSSTSSSSLAALACGRGK